jgi:hypothetical protein
VSAKGFIAKSNDRDKKKIEYKTVEYWRLTGKSDGSYSTGQDNHEIPFRKDDLDPTDKNEAYCKISIKVTITLTPGTLTLAKGDPVPTNAPYPPAPHGQHVWESANYAPLHKPKLWGDAVKFKPMGPSSTYEYSIALDWCASSFKACTPDGWRRMEPGSTQPRRRARPEPPATPVPPTTPR